jgi:hypothetical protein
MVSICKSQFAVCKKSFQKDVLKNADEIDPWWQKLAADFP